MADPACIMQVWADPPRGFVRINGRATATAAPDFVAVIDRLRAQGSNCFVLELSECSLMDSTFVGQLANLALAQDNPAGSTSNAANANSPETPAARRVMLVNPGRHLTDLLDTIFVLDLFEVVHGTEINASPTETVETAAATASREQVNRCCLEAHRVLAALSPANAIKFQDVIRFLEQGT